MFIDETTITIKAGDGGNGCYAHERQRAKPWGRPSGGSGGRGGHVIIEGCAQLHTLQDVAYQHTIRAKRGAHGKGSGKHGKNGESITIKVPLGTIVIDNLTREMLVDCIKDGQQTILAHGGKGGRGNQDLTTRTTRNPDHAEYGEPGEQRQCLLQLKVLADVGLVGRPNAGKSTFLASVSHAHPKIADYPFTTLYPNLGIVKIAGSYESFMMADIPGLIDGSHEGKGLGTRFLRHIERTRVLAVLVDATDPDPLGTSRSLLSELEQYSPRLCDKPRLHILTKTDLTGPDIPLAAPEGWLTMSAVSGANVSAVIYALNNLLKEAGAAHLDDDEQLMAERSPVSSPD